MKTNTQQEAVTDGRIPALDGLRGVAVIAVIAVHANVLFGGDTVGGASAVVARLLGAGWIGVDLFFCLSGFLITRILRQARRGEHYFRNFYARRVLRIMPLYYAFVALVFLVAFRLPMAPHRLAASEVSSVLLYMNNFWYAATGTAVPHLGHFWSLAVEEHFYLLWPLAVRLLIRRRLMQLCLAGTALSLLLRVVIVIGGWWPYSAYLMTPCRLDGLLLGALVALAVEEHCDHARLRQLLRAAAVPAGMMLAAIVVWNGEFSARPSGADLRLTATVGITALALLLAGAVERAVYGTGWWPQLLRNRWLAVAGRYSYAMYVCHCLFVSTLNWMLGRRLGAWTQCPPMVGKLLAFLTVLLLSLAAGWASFHLWEKYFLKLQRHFTCAGSRATTAVETARERAAAPSFASPKELMEC